MDTKAETKTETKAEATAAETKKEEKKTGSDFKAKSKKAWESFVGFVKPYGNLKEKKLLDVVEPKLTKHVDKVYLVSICVLGILAVYTLLCAYGIGAKFSGLFGLFLIFLLVRFTCELIASKK